MKMRVIEISEYGLPEVLQLKEREIPTPAKVEGLIRVDASGVCRPDLAQRKGLNPPPPGASDILGLEVGGTIEVCGPGVTEYQVGDAVCALLAGGGIRRVLHGARGAGITGPGTLVDPGSSYFTRKHFHGLGKHFPACPS